MSGFCNKVIGLTDSDQGVDALRPVRPIRCRGAALQPHNHLLALAKSNIDLANKFNKNNPTVNIYTNQNFQSASYRIVVSMYLTGNFNASPSATTLAYMPIRKLLLNNRNAQIIFS